MSRTDTSPLPSPCRGSRGKKPTGRSLDDLPVDELLAIYDQADGLDQNALLLLVDSLAAEGVDADILFSVLA